MSIGLITAIYSLTLVLLLAYTVKKSLTTTSLKKSLMIWGVFGFVSSYVILSTYYATLPLEEVNAITGFFVITIIIGILAFFIGLPYLLVAYVHWKIRKNLYVSFVALIISFAVVEIVRPYIFTLITWGGGSTFGSHGGSWAIGSILTVTPLLQFARIGGAVALGVVLVYLVSLLVYPFSKSTKIYGVSLLFVLYLAVRFTATYPSQNNSSVLFGVVQTAFGHVPANQDVDTVSKEHIDSVVHPLVMSFAEDKPQMIILPEDLRYLDLQNTSEHKELTQQLPHTVIVDASTRVTSSGRKNVSIIYDTGTKESLTRNKGFMFPFGEYLPFAIKPLIKLFVGDKALDDYQAMYEYTPGENPYALPTRVGNIGVLICSELTSYTAIESLKKSNPDSIIVQSSLSWMHNSPFYTMGHIFSLKLLAVMTGKPVIAVANGGPTIMLDVYGKVTDFEENTFATHLYTLTPTTITKVK